MKYRLLRLRSKSEEPSKLAIQLQGPEQDFLKTIYIGGNNKGKSKKSRCILNYLLVVIKKSILYVMYIIQIP